MRKIVDCFVWFLLATAITCSISLPSTSYAGQYCSDAQLDTIITTIEQYTDGCSNCTMGYYLEQASRNTPVKSSDVRANCPGFIAYLSNAVNSKTGSCSTAAQRALNCYRRICGQ